MTIAAWPAAVPQGYKIDTLNVRLQRNVADFEAEVGPPLGRRRSSLQMEDHSYERDLTETQYAALKSFYKDDLKDGTLQFTRTHPRTGADIVCKFVEAPDDHGGRPGVVRTSIHYLMIRTA